MALNAKIVTVVQPGTTGQQTYTLPAGFNAKAIIVTTVARTTSGAGRTHSIFAYGFGTYRGGSVQQRWLAGSSEDNIATSDTYSGHGSDALLKIPDGTTGTPDGVISLVSLGATNFVLDWTALHTTASIEVSCILLGGDDVEDALVADFARQTTPADQDVTVASGFGQPSVVLVHHCAGRAHQADPLFALRRVQLGFGVRSGSSNGRAIWSASADNAATSTCTQRIDNATITSYTGVSVDSEFAFAASGWPTDGFRITYTTQLTTLVMNYLALRFAETVTVTAGQGAAPTAAPTVVQTLTSADTPKLALLYGTRHVTANALDGSSVDCAAGGVGAIDSGGAECWAGWADDDAISTGVVAGSSWSTSRAIQYHDPASPATLTSEATGGVTGSDFQLSWADTDAAAYLYEWLTLGAASPAGPIHPISQYSSFH